MALRVAVRDSPPDCPWTAIAAGPWCALRAIDPLVVSEYPGARPTSAAGQVRQVPSGLNPLLATVRRSCLWNRARAFRSITRNEPGWRI